MNPLLNSCLGRAKALQYTGSRARTGRIIYTSTAAPTLNDMRKSESWKKHPTVIINEEFTYGLSLVRLDWRLAQMENNLRVYHGHGIGKHVCGMLIQEEQITELPLTPSPRRRTYRGSDTGIAFSPQGNIIAGGISGEIVLWDATDGKVLMTLPQPEESQRAITLCFSPCGQYLVSGAWWQSGFRRFPFVCGTVATGKNIATSSGGTLPMFSASLFRRITPY